MIPSAKVEHRAPGDLSPPHLAMPSQAAQVPQPAVASRARHPAWPRLWGALPGALAVGVPLALLLLHAAHYLPFVADDALISLRYAQRLLDGHGLTWSAGTPVEGYSNLLWILLNALLGAFGLDLIVASRLLGAICGGAMMVALAQVAGPPTWRRLPAAWAAGGLYAASGTAAVWTVGGLEQPLVAACLAWAFVGARPLLAGAHTGSARRPWRVGVPLAALCLTRPDGPLFVALLALVAFAAQRDLAGGAAGPRSTARRVAHARAVGRTVAVTVVALPAAAVLTQLLFRWITYRDWVPNTAHIKAHWSPALLRSGLAALGEGLMPLAPALALTAVGLGALLARTPPLPAPTAPPGTHTEPAADPATEPTLNLDRGDRWAALLVGLWLLAWCAYVASVGGDIFPAHRHLTPVVAGLALLTALGWRRLLDAPTTRGPVIWAQACAGLALAAGLALTQRADPENRRAETERWEWDGAVIGAVLRSGFTAHRPLLAVTAAGTLPYFSGLDALDLLGLNDHHIARQAPDPHGALAHAHGDGDYVLRRAPDLIVFGTHGAPPRFRSGEQMAADPRFRHGYQRFEIEGYVPYRVRMSPYLRLDGPLGVQTHAAEVRVPAWLLSGAVAQPNAQGAVVARLPAGAPAESPFFALPAGRWRLTLEPEHPWLAVAVRGVPIEAVDRAAGTVQVEAAARIQVRITAPHADTPLAALRFEALATPAPPTPAAPSAGTDHVPVPPHPEAARRAWHTVRAGLPPEILAAASATALATFDHDLDGWHLTGRAFARSPHPDAAVARHHLHSLGRHPLAPDADAATGTATSPPFVVPPAAWLSLRLGGGDASGLDVRLLDGDRVEVAWVGTRSAALHTVTYDLRALAHRALRVQARDAATGAWSHLRLDDLRLLHLP